MLCALRIAGSPPVLEDEDSGAPVEGPARPPTHEPDAEPPEPEAPDPEIDFAPPPPEPEPDEELAAAPPEPPPEVSWPDPGPVPSDGAGAIVAGSLLVPTAVGVTWALLSDPRLSKVDQIGIGVAGVGMGGIGLGILGLGIYRRVKIRRWAAAYRVVPTPQGGGLLTLGSLGGLAGLTLAPLGVYVLAQGGNVPVGAGMLAGGLVSLGVVTPLGFVFGLRQAARMRATGGWTRPPLPQVPQVRLRPQLMLGADRLGLGVAGEF